MSGSNAFTHTPKIGWPTVPRMFLRWGIPPTFTSDMLHDTTGDSSVQPYPSSGSTPNLAKNSSCNFTGSFSAPHTMRRSVRKSSAPQRRM